MERQQSRQDRTAISGSAYAISGKTRLPSEYAKYKNRHYNFACGDMIYGSKRGWRARDWNVAMTDEPSQPLKPATPSERKPLPEAAKRALAEAEARRQAAAADAKPAAKEYQGPKGPEPTRYGDWENKGIASDF
jgi:hypothetical protein